MVVRDAQHRLSMSLCHETMSVGWEDLRGAITVSRVILITIASVIALWRDLLLPHHAGVDIHER